MAKRKRRPQRLKSPQHEVDIVIPVYGRPDLLRKCLQGVELAGLDVDYRLILVDDQSPNPGEMDLVYSGLNGQAKVTKNPQNLGFPATANRGAAMGNAPAILFLNSDVVLQGGAIRRMLATLWGGHGEEKIKPEGMDSNLETVGVVAPKLLFPDESHDPSRPAGKVQHAGIVFNGSGTPVHVCIGWSADNPKVNIPRNMQAVSGACLMTRRDVWDHIARGYRQMGDPSGGGFSEVYGRGTYEDVEFCLAVRSAGYRVVYEPRAVGTHWVGASAEQVQEGYPINRNHNVFMARAGHMFLWCEWLYW